MTMQLNGHENLIKVRDDDEPLRFIVDQPVGSDETQFKFIDSKTTNWAADGHFTIRRVLRRLLLHPRRRAYPAGGAVDIPPADHAERFSGYGFPYGAGHAHPSF